MIAVEPVPSNRERLCANLRLNGVAEVTDVCPAAASDRSRRLVMTLREDFRAGAATGNAAVLIDDGTDRRFDRFPVDARPLDDILDEFDVRRVDVVKADVEGHEDKLLRGAMRAFGRWRPVGFFEWNRVYYQRRRIDPTATVGVFLRELNYRCLRRHGFGWVESPEFTSPREVDDVVLVPAERSGSVRALLDACIPYTGRGRP